jgi:uncharacterized protein YggE
MSMSFAKTLVLASLLFATGVQAQTLVVVPAYGEVTRANDEAVLTLAVEEQDKDKDAAASRVNATMKRGMEIVRRIDPTARLQTRRYYTNAVYAEDVPGRPVPAKRVQIGWRVSQSLDVKTTNLAGLQKTAGAALGLLQIERVRFGLSAALTKQLDDERIGATYRNLTERIASIARAMGKTPADATLDTVDFEGSGNYTDRAASGVMQRIEVTGSRISREDMAEPSFEPGETTLQMRLVGKVKFR